jgi:DNA-binding IclR family transcriptional regulator
VVERDEASKRYTLGIVLAEYGRVALNKLNIRDRAKRFLQTLSEFSGETAVLAVLDGTKMVMVDKTEPPIPIRASPFLGMRFPATTSSNGKVLLAWLPTERVAQIIKTEGLPARTKHSITDVETYLADLERTRRRGYASEQEEFHEGASAVSAPVFSAAHDVMATLSIVGPAFRMTEDKIHRYGEKCLELASALTAELK